MLELNNLKLGTMIPETNMNNVESMATLLKRHLKHKDSLNN